MTHLRRALVAGGTGLVGSELLRLLDHDARYSHVTSLGRRIADDAGKIATSTTLSDPMNRSTNPE